MTSLTLKTDFRDWYDHAFDLKGVPFERMSKGGMNRREMLTLMEQIGLDVPLHGLVSEVVPFLEAGVGGSLRSADPEGRIEVVVYHDETAHTGEGKEKMSGAEALRLYRDRYCTEYISAEPEGESLRFLQVGRRSWWIRYWSEQGWMSNVGEGGFEVLHEESPCFPGLAPLYAVDMVKKGDRLFALDYNVAPGLAPLRGVLTAREVVDLLQEAVAYNESRRLHRASRCGVGGEIRSRRIATKLSGGVEPQKG